MNKNLFKCFSMLLITIGFLAGFFSFFAEAQDIEMSISLLKTEITPYEPNWLIYRVINKTDSVQMVGTPKQMPYTFRIKVFDEKGEEIKQRSFLISWVWTSYIELPSGSSYIGNVDISQKITSPGRYTIQVEVDWFTKYQFVKGGLIEVFTKQPITSANIVVLTINRPINESAEAVKTIGEGLVTAETWKKVLEKYPGSTYAKYARYYLARDDEYQEIIQAYPDFELNDYLQLQIAERYYRKGYYGNEGFKNAKKELEIFFERYPESIWKNEAKQLQEAITNPDNPNRAVMVLYPKGIEKALFKKSTTNVDKTM